MRDWPSVTGTADGSVGGLGGAEEEDALPGMEVNTRKISILIAAFMQEPLAATSFA
jgi:hypothetical protein